MTAAIRYTIDTPLVCRAAAQIRGSNRASMTRFIAAVLLLLVLLVGYWVWPFFGLQALGAAVRTGDAQALSEQVFWVSSSFLSGADYPQLSAHNRSRKQSWPSWCFSIRGRGFYR